MYRKKTLLLLLGLFCLFLSGCAGAPIGLGGKYEVLNSSSEYIQIRIDTMVAYESEADSAASAHCAKYSRVERLRSVECEFFCVTCCHLTYSCIDPMTIVSKDCGFIVIEYHGDYYRFEEIYNLAKRHCSSCEKKAQPPQITSAQSRSEDTKIVTVKCE